jgi:hypothetical protein
MIYPHNIGCVWRISSLLSNRVTHIELGTRIQPISMGEKHRLKPQVTTNVEECGRLWKRYEWWLGIGNTTRRLVHLNHVFVTIMQLLSKPTKFETMQVLVLCVIIVSNLDRHICNYNIGETKEIFVNATMNYDCLGFNWKCIWKLGIFDPIFLALIDEW